MKEKKQTLALYAARTTECKAWDFTISFLLHGSVVLLYTEPTHAVENEMLVKEESTRGCRRLLSGYKADGDSRSNRSVGKTSTLNVFTLESGNDKQISGKRRRQRHEYLLPVLVASKPSLTFALPR